MGLQKYKELISQFIKFKSISTDPKYKTEIRDTVKWLKDLFETNDFEVEVLEGANCNPVVLANYIDSPEKETVMVYGHYDVQPAEQDEGWDGDPFNLSDIGDSWVARGIVDNKGQIMIHIFTVFELIKSNQLKYNVKFLIEGNEETANEDLPDILKSNKSKFETDYILISDGEIVADYPAIEISLRGGLNVNLKYRTARDKLHSGLYGGAAPNAAFELSKILSNLLDIDRKIHIPGFYDNVDEITKEQRNQNEKLSEFAKAMIAHAEIKKIITENNNDFFTQTGFRPAIEITGLKSGYIDEGFANIIPNTAEARINFRLVASQDANKIGDLFEKFIEDNTPRYIDYSITKAHIHNPVKVDTSQPIVNSVRKLLTSAYNKEPFLKPVGGAIPIVGDFKETLGIDTLLVPLGNDDCNMHGANENFKVDLIKKGLKFSKMFFSN